MKRVVVLFSVFALVGCGDKSSTTSSTVTSTTVAISTTTTSTTFVPVKDRCGVSQLQVAQVGQDAGAGQRYEIFAMKNIGASPCVVRGYPGVAAYAGARPVVSQSSRNPNSEILETNTLKPQDEVYFTVHYAVVPTGNDQEQCQNVDTLQVTLPETTSQLIVSVNFGSLCPSTGLSVSPLVSGKPNVGLDQVSITPA